jgi:uncharacterized protein with PIN domain
MPTGLEIKEPRFIADAMLGKLARWLRILGFDTFYDSQIKDDELVAAGEREDRIVLTKDTGVMKRRRGRKIFITSNHWREQVREVLGALDIEKPPGVFSRCVECNVPLEPAPRDSVESLVPPYVFRTRQEFSRCSGCRRIYWAATHYEKMCEELGRILENRFPTEAPGKDPGGPRAA